eukprot:4726907-Pyramimonas_sp.AAC.1
MYRDTETLVSTRLMEPWSAPSFAGNLKSEVIETVQQRYPHLEQPVRLRVLLSALSLKKGPLSALGPQLRKLAEMAKDDEDDWVRVFGHAVGDFNGPLDLEAVKEAVPEVGCLTLVACSAIMPVVVCKLDGNCTHTVWTVLPGDYG